MALDSTIDPISFAPDEALTKLSNLMTQGVKYPQLRAVVVSWLAEVRDLALGPLALVRKSGFLRAFCLGLFFFILGIGGSLVILSSFCIAILAWPQERLQMLFIIMVPFALGALAFGNYVLFPRVGAGAAWLFAVACAFASQAALLAAPWWPPAVGVSPAFLGMACLGFPAAVPSVDVDDGAEPAVLALVRGRAQRGHWLSTPGIVGIIAQGAPLIRLQILELCCVVPARTGEQTEQGKPEQPLRPQFSWHCTLPCDARFVRPVPHRTDWRRYPHHTCTPAD